MLQIDKHGPVPTLLGHVAAIKLKVTLICFLCSIVNKYEFLMFHSVFICILHSVFFGGGGGGCNINFYILFYSELNW